MRTVFSCWVRLLALLVAVGVASLQQEEVVQDQYIFASRYDEWNFGSTTAMGGGVRAIIKKVLSVEQAEGIGARVRRSIRGAEIRWDQGAGESLCPTPLFCVTAKTVLFPFIAEESGPISDAG